MNDTSDTDEDNLLEHYDFDYSKAKPNRFAAQIPDESTFIMLEPDVAAVFPTPESVNEALRLLITAAQNLNDKKHSPVHP
jgi:hypothetical protein